MSEFDALDGDISDDFDVEGDQPFGRMNSDVDDDAVLAPPAYDSYGQGAAAGFDLDADQRTFWQKNRAWLIAVIVVVGVIAVVLIGLAAGGVFGGGGGGDGDVPGAPTLVFAFAGDSSATVTFKAPADEGGSAITGYTVTAQPGGREVSGTRSPIVVSALTNGVEYRFTVRATNSAGDGPASDESNAVVPSGSTPTPPPTPPPTPTPPPPTPNTGAAPMITGGIYCLKTGSGQYIQPNMTLGARATAVQFAVTVTPGEFPSFALSSTNTTPAAQDIVLDSQAGTATLGSFQGVFVSFNSPTETPMTETPLNLGKQNAFLHTLGTAVVASPLASGAQTQWQFEAKSGTPTPTPPSSQPMVSGSVYCIRNAGEYIQPDMSMGARATAVQFAVTLGVNAGFSTFLLSSVNTTPTGLDIVLDAQAGTAVLGAFAREFTSFEPVTTMPQTETPLNLAKPGTFLQRVGSQVVAGPLTGAITQWEFEFKSSGTPTPTPTPPGGAVDMVSGRIYCLKEGGDYVQPSLTMGARATALEFTVEVGVFGGTTAPTFQLATLNTAPQGQDIRLEGAQASLGAVQGPFVSFTAGLPSPPQTETPMNLAKNSLFMNRDGGAVIAAPGTGAGTLWQFEEKAVTPPTPPTPTPATVPPAAALNHQVRIRSPAAGGAYIGEAGGTGNALELGPIENATIFQITRFTEIGSDITVELLADNGVTLRDLSINENAAFPALSTVTLVERGSGGGAPSFVWRLTDGQFGTPANAPPLTYASSDEQFYFATSVQPGFITGGLLPDQDRILRPGAAAGAFYLDFVAAGQVVPTPPPAAAVRYAILVAGQSNAQGNNNGPIELFGRDAPEPITAEHPFSRIVMISNGTYTDGTPIQYAAYTDTGGTAAPRGLPMRARYPIPYEWGATCGVGGTCLSTGYQLDLPEAVSFPLRFAKRCLERMRPEDELWIISAAYSGSSVNTLGTYGTWQPDVQVAPPRVNHFQTMRTLFNNAIDAYGLQPAVFLWQQGESDVGNVDYKSQLYGAPNSVLRRLRDPVFGVHGAQNVPILAGTMFESLSQELVVLPAQEQMPDELPNSEIVRMNEAPNEVTNVVNGDSPYSFKVGATGLITYTLPNGEPLHMTAEGQRRMGEKYFAAYLNSSRISDPLKSSFQSQ